MLPLSKFILTLLYTHNIPVPPADEQPKPSHRLPPLAKHIVDEFSHRLRAAVATSVSSVLEMLHHLPDELSKEVGDVLVALGCWHLLEVTAVLLSQAATLVLTHLPSVAQVLLVSHQTHRNWYLPETETWADKMKRMWRQQLSQTISLLILCSNS